LNSRRASRELAKKVGVEIKQVYLTSGEHDIIVIAEAGWPLLI
jgi:uncharacterized protein with GYD domain